MKLRKVVFYVAILVLVCLAGSLIVYNFLLPAPFAVIRQIEADLPRQGPPIMIFRSGPAGILEELFPSDPKIHSYEIVDVVDKDPQNDKLHLLISDEATKALCVTALVTIISPYDQLLPSGSTNPQYYNYLAMKVNGEWSVRFLDHRAESCK